MEDLIKADFLNMVEEVSNFKKIELNHRTKQKVCFHFAVNRRASIQFLLFITSVAYFFEEKLGWFCQKLLKYVKAKDFERSLFIESL